MTRAHDIGLLLAAFAAGTLYLAETAHACIANVRVDRPTNVYSAPNSDYVLWTLAPPDVVCLVTVSPGAHPAGIHFQRLSAKHGGYMDTVQEPEMNVVPTSE